MQNFEPTGAAAAMPGSAVPQIKRRLVISACLLIPLFYLGLGAAFGLPLPPFLTGDNAMWCGIVQLVLTVPVCWLNRSYFINGCKSIRAPGPDTLVALSSGAALVYGIIAIFTQDAPQELFLPSAAAILIFAAACQLLEVRFKAQAMAPLHSLAERIPETACVLRSRQQYTVPLNEVAVGDIFLIRPGDVMPVDGVVIEGETTVDESALTGESIPVDKAEGDSVSAATLNQSGFLRCRATRVGQDTTLAQIIQMVSDARGAAFQEARLVHRRGRDGRARRLVGRDTLARERRLVDRARALEHHAVHRHALARLEGARIANQLAGKGFQSGVLHGFASFPIV